MHIGVLVRRQWTAIVLALLTVTAIALSAPSTAGPMHLACCPALDESYFKLVNGYTMCLAVAGGSTAPGTPAVQYICDADPSRLWDSDYINRFSNTIPFDQYIQNDHSGLCLEPTYGGLGASLVQEPCNTADPLQAWTDVSLATASIHEWVNSATGLCMTTTSTARNAGIVLGACDPNNPTDSWYYAGTDRLIDTNSGMCITTVAVGAPVVQQPCAPDPSEADQFLHFLPSTTGLEAVNDVVNARYCLAARDSGINDDIILQPCDGDVFQQWRVVLDYSAWYGTYWQVQNLATNYCISPAGGSTAGGMRMVQYYCDGDPSRVWYIGPVLGRYYPD